jgi:hypothetical protein
METGAKLPAITFDNRGFLSGRLCKWTASTRRDNKKWFSFIKRLNRAAMKVLAAVEPDPKKNQELSAALLYRRALQSFQGSILLAERGMIAEALTLVRSCAETAIALGCVAADKKFIDELFEGDGNHRLTYANVILGDKYLREPLDTEQVGHLKEKVSEVKTKYAESPNSRPEKINWADAAKDAGMTVLYDTVYRTASGSASHVSLIALDRHVIPDADGGIGKLTFQPETRDLVLSLTGATSAILHAMDALGRIFPQKEINRSVKRYADLWSELVP